MDRGLPSVRSARGLQGRQELGRMLVCVTDFVLRLNALGQLLLEEMSLVCGRADLEDGLEGLRVEGADALEAG